ncbi:MAG: histidine--tRNA ligase [Oscillospiraceae bacterium]
MERIKPHTLSGFMELLPPQQAQFDRIMDTLRRVYSLYGFTPLDTPAIESSDVLLAKGGGETEKQIYRFTKGDSDIALRFDLTVPLAKYVALHYGELTFPFRRYQISKVYRGERAQRGRFREFYQADIDVIGDGALSLDNEAEIPSIIHRAFTELGLSRFVIRVNNRKLLTGFYDMLGLSDKSGDIMRTVDKLEKIGAQKVKAILTDDFDITVSDADEILRFISIKGTNSEIISSLENYRGKNETFDLGLDELIAVTRHLGAFGVPEERFAVDLTIARGLDYYTGTVYETVMLDHPEVGSVCSGGRYDNLAEYYTDKKLPGVGISIGLTRLFYVLSEQHMLNPAVNTAPADVLVIPMGDGQRGYAISAATKLREFGIRTQIYSEQKKFKQKITYASKLGIPFAVFLGEDEETKDLVSLKDLTKGEQVTVPLDEAVGIINTALKAQSAASVIFEQAHAESL